MWSRVVEVMLGVWLLLSPFIFRHPTGEVAWWANDFACAALAITFGCLSFWEPTRRAHLATAALALWLIGFGYFSEPHPSPPAMQNDVFLGLLLLMFAIIPNDASLPPEGWRERVPLEERAD
jgi:hypothetical protein